MSETEEFFEAVEKGDTEQLRALLSSNPALVRARDDKGATALHVAAFHGQRAVAELLCAAGADINARDNVYHATPSGWAIEYLRERGGLLAIEIEDVLHAIRMHDAGWARRLIKRHPALLKAADLQGKPLAEHARESGIEEIAKLFLAAKGG